MNALVFCKKVPIYITGFSHMMVFVLTYMCITALFSFSASQDRVAFMLSLNLSHGLPHLIERNDVFTSVMAMYQEKLPDILQEYPFRIRFKGEMAVDVGGVARDMYSAFFEEAYKYHFDGNTLLSPIVHPEMDTSLISTMGSIISHAYMVAGVLPVRIAFPSLSRCLLGSTVSVSSSILVEALIDSLSPHEAIIVKKASDEVQQQISTFSSDVISGLLSVLSRFNVRTIPMPSKFKQIIVQIASYEFLSKPSAALTIMNSGVPEEHKPFWEGLGIATLFSIYQAQSASTSTVLKMVEGAVGGNSNEERVLGYLRQFIGNMGSDTLRNFLRFVTGSSVCSSLKIQVSFNSLCGAARRPIVHTCGPSLELSWTYNTYLEFVEEFNTCMSNPYAWVMDAL